MLLARCAQPTGLQASRWPPHTLRESRASIFLVGGLVKSLFHGHVLIPLLNQTNAEFTAYFRRCARLGALIVDSLEVCARTFRKSSIVSMRSNSSSLRPTLFYCSVVASIVAHIRFQLAASLDLPRSDAAGQARRARYPRRAVQCEVFPRR